MKHTIKISLCSTNSKCRPIRLRVSFIGKRVDLPSGVSWDVDKWIQDSARPKPNTKNQFRQSAAEINKILNDECDFVDQYFTECEFRNIDPAPTDLKKRFLMQFRSSARPCESLPDLYDEFLSNQSGNKSWSDNTRKLYNQVRRLIVDMDELTADSLDELTADLIDSGHNNSTTIFYLKRIKTFGKWLRKRGMLDFDIDKYEINLKTIDDKHIIYLDTDELNALVNARIDSQTIERVRDVFVFCCYCGLRHSDVRKLRKTDIHNGCINIVTLKTHDPLAIELNKTTSDILNKYADCDDVLALPVQALKEYNENIQVACKIAGIDTPTTKTAYVGAERIETVRPKYECVSSHTARKTFVVQCLTRGIPAEVIIQWTGHKDFDAMKPYFAITNATKRNAMAKLNDESVIK